MITPSGRCASEGALIAFVRSVASVFARHVRGEIGNVNGASVLCR